MKNLNGKQNLDLDFVKFYCTTDTISTRTILDYFGFLSCASCVPSTVTL